MLAALGACRGDAYASVSPPASPGAAGADREDLLHVRPTVRRLDG
jgi:hypothetical protein